MHRFHLNFVRASFLLALAVLFLQSTLAQAQVRRIADLNPGSTGSFPSNFTAVASSLYFTAYTSSTGFELWEYTNGAVRLAAEINNTNEDVGGGTTVGNDSVPAWLTPFNGALYFSAFEPRRGAELWKYEGGTATRVSDINPDVDESIKFEPKNAWPNQLTVFNNHIYFSANSGAAVPNYELWKYNGVTATLVTNIHADAGPDGSSYPIGLTEFNGALYFMADDGVHGYELWKHDGATTVMLADINPGNASSSSFPKNFTVYNNQLYFQALNSASGFELWRTDGTNVTLAAEINPAAESSFPVSLTVFDGALWFSATDGVNGFEVWRYDGVTAAMARDVNPAGDSFPKNFTVAGSTLYFAADDGVHGWELWKVAGSTVELVSDLNPIGDSFPELLTPFSGALYFAAESPEAGREVWKYNGSAITLAADVNGGVGSSHPRGFAEFNGELFFSAASDGFSDWEPWALPGDSNSAPLITLTSPVGGSGFTTADTITISASASDDVGVARVEFFANGISLGSSSAAPYSVATNLAVGAYSLTATATDAAGAATTSSPISITVHASAQPPRITSITNSGDTYTITVTGTSGVPHTLEWSNDFVTWTVLETKAPVGGIATFTDVSTDRKRFYRVAIR